MRAHRRNTGKLRPGVLNDFIGCKSSAFNLCWRLNQFPFLWLRRRLVQVPVVSSHMDRQEPRESSAEQ